jgi:hypothetical protein
LCCSVFSACLCELRRNNVLSALNALPTIAGFPV